MVRNSALKVKARALLRRSNCLCTSSSTTHSSGRCMVTIHRFKCNNIRTRITRLKVLGPAISLVPQFILPQHPSPEVESVSRSSSGMCVILVRVEKEAQEQGKEEGQEEKEEARFKLLIYYSTDSSSSSSRSKSSSGKSSKSRSR